MDRQCRLEKLCSAVSGRSWRASIRPSPTARRNGAAPAPACDGCRRSSPRRRQSGRAASPACSRLRRSRAARVTTGRTRRGPCAPSPAAIAATPRGAAAPRCRDVSRPRCARSGPRPAGGGSVGRRLSCSNSGPSRGRSGPPAPPATRQTAAGPAGDARARSGSAVRGAAGRGPAPAPRPIALAISSLARPTPGSSRRRWRRSRAPGRALFGDERPLCEQGLVVAAW